MDMGMDEGTESRDVLETEWKGEHCPADGQISESCSCSIFSYCLVSRIDLFYHVAKAPSLIFLFMIFLFLLSICSTVPTWAVPLFPLQQTRGTVPWKQDGTDKLTAGLPVLQRAPLCSACETPAPVGHRPGPLKIPWEPCPKASSQLLSLPHHCVLGF